MSLYQSTKYTPSAVQSRIKNGQLRARALLEEHLENLLDPETDSISTVFSVDLFEIFNNEKELMDFARAELENILDDLNKLDETQAYKYVTDDINEPWYVCRFRIVENNSTTK